MNDQIVCASGRRWPWTSVHVLHVTRGVADNGFAWARPTGRVDVERLGLRRWLWRLVSHD